MLEGLTWEVELPLKYVILIIYAIYLLIMGFVGFGMYRADKKKAEKGYWRTPEKVLLFIPFLGCCFGSYLAMLVLRHKTKREHWYFTFCNVLAMILHITALILIALLVDF